MRLATLLLLLLLAPSAGAQTKVATDAPVAAYSLTKEAALNGLFNVLVPQESISAALVAAYEKRFKSDWDAEHGGELEAKHPGLFAATLKVGSDTYAAGIGRHYPKLRAEYVRLASDRLTQDGVDQFARLLSSPSGQKLMASVLSSLSAGVRAEEARTKAIAALQSNASADDIKVLSMFSEGPTAQKLIEVRAAFRPLIAAWSSALNSETNPLIAKNVEAATADFLLRAKNAGQK